MNVPTVFAMDVIGKESPITIGLAIGLLAVGAAWGEARIQIAALREWRGEAKAQIEALLAENAGIKATAVRQSETINHILQLLNEVRDDLKILLQRNPK